MLIHAKLGGFFLQFNVAHGGDAAEDLRQHAVAPARSDLDRNEYLEDRADEADRDAVVGEYSERHRRRLHDADEIAGDPRELSANAIHSPERVMMLGEARGVGSFLD